MMVEERSIWAMMREIPVYQRICMLMPGCRCRSRIGRRSAMNKSVTDILEEFCNDICDNYCKYRNTEAGRGVMEDTLWK